MISFPLMIRAIFSSDTAKLTTSLSSESNGTIIVPLSFPPICTAISFSEACNFAGEFIHADMEGSRINGIIAVEIGISERIIIGKEEC